MKASTVACLDAILSAVKNGDLAAVAAALEADSTPLTLAAGLVAALRLGQADAVQLLLERGAPVEFAVGSLPAPCLQALQQHGMAEAGLAFLTPLALAVQVQQLRPAQLLLQHGAYSRSLCCGRPLLLLWYEAAEAAGGIGPSASPAAQLGAQQFLLLLLAHGADPLQQQQPLFQPCQAQQQAQQQAQSSAASFLSTCQDAHLLQHAVRHVLAQFTAGLRGDLTPTEASQLMQAAVRSQQQQQKQQHVQHQHQQHQPHQQQHQQQWRQ